MSPKPEPAKNAIAVENDGRATNGSRPTNDNHSANGSRPASNPPANGDCPAPSRPASDPPANRIFAYFPGCSADSTGVSYTLSTLYVADRLGITLREIPDWCCCGTSAASLTNANLALALPARSLAISERELPGLDVLVPCPGCLLSLKSSIAYTRSGEQNREHIEDLIEMPYTAAADALGILDILTQPDYLQEIESHLVRNLGGLKLACYYGCALVRPRALFAEQDAENPQSIDELMRLAGAETVDWAYKTECCGASHQIALPKGSRRLVADIFTNAQKNGAEAIVTACPLCFINLDMREAEINSGASGRGDNGGASSSGASGSSGAGDGGASSNAPATAFDLPVYYFTELLGLCMGGDARELGIGKHFWPAEQLAQRAVTAAAAADTEDAIDAPAPPSSTKSAAASAATAPAPSPQTEQPTTEAVSTNE